MRNGIAGTLIVMGVFLFVLGWASDGRDDEIALAAGAGLVTAGVLLRRDDD